MQELIQAIKESGDKPDVAVMVDGDPYDIEWPESWHIHKSEEHLELQQAMNALFRLHPNEKTYGMLVDHTRPGTPGWVKILEDAAGDWNISLADDGYNRINPKSGLRRIASATCFGGELIRTLGWIWPPFCVHLYGDDAIEEIGHELGLFRITTAKCGDLQFETGEVKIDENHKRMYKGKPYALDDRDAFHKWRNLEKPGLLHLLKRVIPEGCRDLSLTPRKVTICCVQAQNYQSRGAEYVNNLADMVYRNMPENIQFRFVCFTDNEEGIHPSIETAPLPEVNLGGWWNKLALFRRGVFQPYERVFYFDLDTLVIGNLGEILSYDGELCLLQDFYRPKGLGSGVMSWIPEKNYYIWDLWVKYQRPILKGGDQEWIEKINSSCDTWQTRYPGQILSYKADCNPYPKQDAAIVCFHGEPRPHNCTQKWVKDVWKVGGVSALNLTVVPNTSDKSIFDNILTNANSAPWVMKSPAHDEVAVICGSGPSLIDSIDEIKWHIEQGGKVFALNNAAQALLDNGIIADYQVILDARESNTSLINIGNVKSYLLASQCHPKVFESVKGQTCYLWHPFIEGIDALFPDRNITMVGGGTTVGLSSMALAYTMGFRKLALFGYDSSFKDGHTHAIKQERTKQENWSFDVTVGDKTFQSNAAMAKQAELFPHLARDLANLDCEIGVYGYGLLPYIAQIMADQASIT